MRLFRRVLRDDFIENSLRRVTGHRTITVTNQKKKEELTEESL